MLDYQICLPYRHMNSTEQPKTPVFCLILVRSCGKFSQGQSLVPLTNSLHPELSLGSYRSLVQTRLGRRSQFTALSYLLRTDLASLGLQRCREPLPPQKHPFCFWKHQGDGRGRQIKCNSQTRIRLQTMRQTKRARKSRSKSKEKAVSPVRLQHDFMCPDLSRPITTSAVRSPHLEKKRHANS